MINLVSNKRLVIPDPRQIFTPEELVEDHIVGVYEQVIVEGGESKLVPEFTGRVLKVVDGLVTLTIHTKGQELGLIPTLNGPYTYQGRDISELPPTDHRGFAHSLAFMGLARIGDYHVVGDMDQERDFGKWRCSATIDMTE